MFSLTIKGKENPKSPQLVKLEMIFFKTGYARIPKVLSITGPFSEWDNETQCFTSKSSEALEKNKRLLDLKTKYLKVAEDWEAEKQIMGSGPVVTSLRHPAAEKAGRESYLCDKSTRSYH